MSIKFQYLSWFFKNVIDPNYLVSWNMPCDNYKIWCEIFTCYSLFYICFIKVTVLGPLSPTEISWLLKKIGSRPPYLSRLVCSLKQIFFQEKHTFKKGPVTAKRTATAFMFLSLFSGYRTARWKLIGLNTFPYHISTVMYVKYLVCYKRILKSVLRPVNCAVWSEDGIL